MTECQLRLDGSSLRLRGVLDKTNVNAVYLQSRRLLKDSQPPDTIDLSMVNHIDSAGLALLLEWQSWAQHANHQLQLEHAPEQLLMLARLSELDRILHLN